MVKWPFFLGDAVLVLLGFVLLLQSNFPPSPPILAVALVGAFLGAVLGVMPYYMEYRGAVRLVASNNLSKAAELVRNLDQVRDAISATTSKLADAQDLADRSVHASSEIADRMTREANDFAEFMTRANDAEKGQLRVALDRLQRSEQDWIQVVTTTLDHTFAIHRAATMAGEEKVAQQLGRLRQACVEAARRVGVAPIVPTAGEAFDAERHETHDQSEVEPGSVIRGIMAVGYSFQGRPVRLAVVAAGQADSPPVEETYDEELEELADEESTGTPEVLSPSLSTEDDELDPDERPTEIAEAPRVAETSAESPDSEDADEIADESEDVDASALDEAADALEDEAPETSDESDDDIPVITSTPANANLGPEADEDDSTATEETKAVDETAEEEESESGAIENEDDEGADDEAPQPADEEEDEPVTDEDEAVTEAATEIEEEAIVETGETVAKSEEEDDEDSFAEEEEFIAKELRELEAIKSEDDEDDGYSDDEEELSEDEEPEDSDEDESDDEDAERKPRSKKLPEDDPNQGSLF